MGGKKYATTKDFFSTAASLNIYSIAINVLVHPNNLAW